MKHRLNLWAVVANAAVAAGLSTGVSASIGFACSAAAMRETTEVVHAERECLISLTQPDRLTEATDKGLRDLIEGAWLRASLHGDPAYVDMLRLAAAEHDRRAGTLGAFADLIHGALLAVGRAAEADAYVQAHPALQVPERPARVPLDRALTGAEASRWTFDIATSRLHEDAVDLSTGLHIVVYMSPQCVFSQRAASGVLQDEALREIFLLRSVWVMVPEPSHSIDVYRDWARAHPELSIGDLQTRTNWPPRRIAAVPYFLVVRDGTVVGEVLGWRPETPGKLRALIGP